MLPEIKAILFDLDGVLVDATEWHYESFNQALHFYNIPVISRPLHLNKYDGLPTREKLKQYPETMNLSTELHHEIIQLKQKLFMEIVDIHWLPNMVHQKTLERLKLEGYKLAVCTNSIRETAIHLLNKAELMIHLDFFLSNQDVEYAKPHPEIYLKAMTILHLQPKNVLICEDNIRGIIAAQKSGAFVLKIESVQDVNYGNIRKEINKIEAHNKILENQ